MAKGATMRVWRIALSDVDRGVYETFELRLAQHPSESLRYLWTRLFGYCLSYADGIQFSRAGLAAAEDAPVTIERPDGTLAAWIDVGQPSADRLHKASKAADQVVIYTCVDIAQLRKEAGRKRIHQVEEIDVWNLPVAVIDSLCERTKRNMELELVRTENQIYATLDGVVAEGEIVHAKLGE